MRAIEVLLHNLPAPAQGRPVVGKPVRSRWLSLSHLPAPPQDRHDVVMDASGYLFIDVYVIPDLIWNLDMRMQKDLSYSKRGL